MASLQKSSHFLNKPQNKQKKHHNKLPTTGPGQPFNLMSKSMHINSECRQLVFLIQVYNFYQPRGKEKKTPPQKYSHVAWGWMLTDVTSEGGRYRTMISMTIAECPGETGDPRWTTWKGLGITWKQLGINSYSCSSAQQKEPCSGALKSWPGPEYQCTPRHCCKRSYRVVFGQPLNSLICKK